MSEQDDKSALVALTERQIRLLLIELQKPRELRPNFAAELKKAENQLRIALYALSEGSDE